MTCRFLTPSRECTCPQLVTLTDKVSESTCNRCFFYDPAPDKNDFFKATGKMSSTEAPKPKKKKKCKGCGGKTIQPAMNYGGNGDWTVVVTTAPRKDPTIHDCLSSLETAGWNPVVFAEPGSESTPDYETHTNSERMGVWHNWLKSCRYALRETDSSLILTVQDDSFFHPDSRSVAEQSLWPSPFAGFISLYTPAHYLKDKPGFHRQHTSSLWGACALVWHRDVLQKVVNHPIATNWMGVPPRKNKKEIMQKRRKDRALVQNSDTAIGKILNRMGLEMWFYNPSPVSHISKFSSNNVGHGSNTGKRNCGNCANLSQPLADQVRNPQGVRSFSAVDFQAGAGRLRRKGFRYSFSIPWSLWERINSYVTPGMPTMELGVGYSTLAFTGCDHIGWEQSLKYASAFKSSQHRPLQDGWYSGNLPDNIPKALLVDGPYSGDRSKAYKLCVQVLEKNGVVWVDDLEYEDSQKLLGMLSNYSQTTHLDNGRMWAEVT